VTIDWLHKMRNAGLTQEQAEAIASRDEHVVTREYFDVSRKADRDYLDARISQLETSLTWRLLGIVGVAIAIVTLVDKFVRPS